ncbi:DNA repair protein RecO [Gudongella oleilytica]|uniref:DNA repair protein RecO n=1 Tax=Gudongella oleilytica TaxID=1582259 RepID=UPI002A36740D|nr:DNA repair protein RecO [Gudongella oleilytica]MDY0255633.1 DNA repair protein RecO [Gudongella oleilytica]
MAKTFGIVLSWIKYKESSKIVTLFTEDLGRISIMAQGALKPKSQILAATEVFSKSHFELKKGKNFYYIESAELESSNFTIRQDIDRLTYGFYILELVERSVPEGESSSKIFNMLDKALFDMSSSMKPILQTVAFELKMISILGYRPQLSKCLKCGRTASEIWDFSIIEGGVYCDSCRKGSGVLIDQALFEAMGNILLSKFDQLDELNLSTEALLRIHSILYQFIIYNLDLKELKSQTMLQRGQKL